MIKVTPQTSLPLSTFINKGTYEQRFKYAQELNAKFFEKIKKKMVNNYVTSDNYYKTLKELIPEITFEVKPYKSSGFYDKNAGQTVIETDKNNTVMNYVIEIPYTTVQTKEETRKNLISLDNFYITMHENFHLLAGICIPKHIARQEFNSVFGADFYEGCIYTDEHKNFNSKEKRHWRRCLKKCLNHFPLQEQINFLQTSRYRLREEQFAWEESKKYTNIKIDTTKFFFEEKIKIMENLLYKLIKKSRNKHKPSLWGYFSKCFFKKDGR